MRENFDPTDLSKVGMCGSLSPQRAQFRYALRYFFYAVVLCAFIPFSWAADSRSVQDPPTQPQKDAEKLPKGLSDSPVLNSRFLLFGSKTLRRQTLRWARRRGDTDMVAALIYTLRYLKPEERREVVTVLRRLSGKSIGDDWFRWMQWQQQTPAIKPFPHFDLFLSALFKSIDPGFTDFIYPNVDHSIRLEEIVWGGGRSKDEGIPPIDHPTLITAANADYLSDEELVFGVQIGEDVRAYPYRIMDWHEMLNDVVGGVPVTLAYCTLCGSGILFDTRVAERAAPFEFGSSGLLYRSNKLMFDRATNSLWNQFTGKPVVGKLTRSGIELKTLPLVTSSWGDWKTAHPDTKVLSLDTGFVRDYRPGKPYGRYFASPKLEFPAAKTDTRLAQKDQVFALRITGAEKAWPLDLFKGGAVINDRVGALPLVLVGDAATSSVRAYRGNGAEFARSDQATDLRTIRSAAGKWHVREDALHGPAGERLTRLPGHIAYWFAWSTYLTDAPVALPKR